LRRTGERINEDSRCRGPGRRLDGLGRTSAADLSEIKAIVDDPMIPRSSIRPRPRLYILTPAVSDAAAFSGVLAEIFGAVDVAAVLLRLPDADERSLINRVKAAAGGVQAAGAALLVDGRPDIVARAGADGAHLAGPDALQAAVRTLKPNYIAGAGGLGSRHDAMVAAEAGADYVMFGEPDAAGHHPSGDAVIDRVAWWAELFEIPCVGYATALDDIDALVAAGADFVAVGDALFDDPRGPEAAAAEAAARLTVTETTT
jgi:thiamine-phosphate pyrophosphorylase